MSLFGTIFPNQNIASQELLDLQNSYVNLPAYQDFTNVVGTSLTLTLNANAFFENGTPAPENIINNALIVSNSATATLSSDTSQYPRTAAFISIKLTSSIITASNNNQTITLSGIPRTADKDNIRIYFYLKCKRKDLPVQYNELPKNVRVNLQALDLEGITTDDELDSRINSITDATLPFSDIATNNASISKHGFLPKLSNSSTQFINGLGNWATPSGIANTFLSQAFSNQISVTVIHNFGVFPVVQLLNSSGEQFIPFSITHVSVNNFTVAFLTFTTGTILATVGSPQLTKYTIVNANYNITLNDYFIQCGVAGTTITLPTAINIAGQIFNIDNASDGYIALATTNSQTIQGALTLRIPYDSSLTVVSNGSNWRIK